MSDTIEAQVIEPTQALTVRGSSGLPTVQDLEQQFQLAVRQRELLSDYIKKQLVPGKHFYQRGTQKPSLAKEGAEIILLPHNLAPDYEQTGGPDAPPPDNRPYQITVKCILRRKGDPASFVGSGIGSAGSEKQLKDGSYQPRQNDKYLCHNATLKMAQKSAMIAATINSTAASEFFTQDMDDQAPESPRSAATRKPPSTPTPPPKSPASTKAAPGKVVGATSAYRAKMIQNLKAAKGEGNRRIVTEYFQKVGPPHPLMPTEELEELPLRFVPINEDEMKALEKRLAEFEAGEPALLAFEPHWENGVPPTPAPTAPATTAKPPHDDEWWREIIVPVPPKGVKRDTYMKHPQTIGMLYELRHGNDEEAQAGRQRLWGFVNHYEPKGWTKKDGTEMPPSDSDIKFREALTAFSQWFSQNHPGEQL